MFPLVLFSLGLLLWSHVDVLKHFSYINWDDHAIFVFYVAYYIYCHAYVDLFLHLQEKANLSREDNLFDICLILIYKEFIEPFQICIYWGYWPACFIVFTLFGYYNDTCNDKGILEYSCISIFITSRAMDLLWKFVRILLWIHLLWICFSVGKFSFLNHYFSLLIWYGSVLDLDLILSYLL